MEKKWYAVRTFPGYEFKVKEKLEKKIEKEGKQTSITEVFVPSHKNFIFVRKKLKEKEELIYPGYVFVQMVMNNENMYFVRGIQYVTGYVGKNENNQFPDNVEDFEVEHMRKQSELIDCVLKPGDPIRINDGFEEFDTIIKDLLLETRQVLVDNYNGDEMIYNFEQIEKG